MNQQHSDHLVLVFSVDAYNFCVPALEVDSVIKKPATAITSVPGSPNAVAGILAHRGQIVTVIDMHRKLGLPVAQKNTSGLLIISRMDDGLTAFWVDGVSDVISSDAVQWYPVTVNTTFTAIDKLGTHDTLFLMHTHLESLALMEDSPQQASQFLRFTESLGIRSSGETQSEPASVSLDEFNDDECHITNDSDENANQIEKPDKVEEDHPLPKKDRGQHKQIINLKTAKTSTIVHTNTARVSISKIKTKPAPEKTKKIQSVIKRKTDKPELISKVGKPTSIGINGILPDQPSPSSASGVADTYGDKEQTPVAPISNPMIRKGRSKFLWIAAGIIASGLFLAFFIQPWQHNGKKANTTVSRYTPSGNTAQTFSAQPPPTIPSGTKIDVTDNHDIKETAFAKPSTATDLPDGDIAQPDTRSTSATEKSESTLPHLDVSEKETVNPVLQQSAETAPTAQVLKKIETGDVPPTLESENSEPHHELIRVETKDFTLTVERPHTDGSKMPPPARLSEDRPITSDKMLVHIVVKGDTLWDIAKSYLGNPMRYPELAKLSHIKDPHWIYPRDVIRIVRR